MCHSRGDPVCDHLGGRGWKDTLWTFFFAQLPICIKLIRNWFSETCQAWLELPSSFINKKLRAGGKKSQERYQKNSTHKHWMTAWASFFRKRGYQPALSGESLQLSPSPVPICPLTTGTVRTVLGTPRAHHWGQRTPWPKP